MKRLIVLSVAGLMWSAWTAAPAEDEIQIEVETETILEGLKNPCAVAVHPKTGEVYVSDSAAQRVIRVRDGKAEDVIVDFPKSTYGKGPIYDIGPLGLAFLDDEHLIVGGGGLADGEELLRVYKLPPAGETVSASEMAHKLGPIAPGEASKEGEGNFYAIAVTEEAIFVSANGDDTKGWVLKSDIVDGAPTELRTFIATKPATEDVDAPVGIAISASGYVVVGQMGEINKPKDSLLTFYGATSGQMRLNLETGLYDITALAYSPSGSLYAADFAWMDGSQGGIFRLDRVDHEDGSQGVKTIPVTSLDKPTALAFDKDGNLYVTVFGEVAEGEQVGAGKLLKLKGDL